ncbi:MAG: DUF6290 family protein [Erysipelotrichaceae bacterium]|nr:DUF6290 family protein [Erysipelotrichaceae bacterium]
MNDTINTHYTHHTYPYYNEDRGTDMTVRKNITMPDEEYQIISDYSKKTGISFSELLRKAALKFIEESEKQSLTEFLNANCEFVDDLEQEDLERILKDADLDISHAEEIDINELF